MFVLLFQRLFFATVDIIPSFEGVTHRDAQCQTVAFNLLMKSDRG